MPLRIWYYGWARASGDSRNTQAQVLDSDEFTHELEYIRHIGLLWLKYNTRFLMAFRVVVIRPIACHRSATIISPSTVAPSAPAPRPPPSAGSCEDATTVFPSARSSSKTPSSAPATPASRLEVGSSAKTTSGRPARARQMATRCCSPRSTRGRVRPVSLPCRTETADFRSPPNFPERPPTCPAMATGGNASGCRWRPRCSYRHGHSRRTQRSASRHRLGTLDQARLLQQRIMQPRLLNRTTISSDVILTLHGVSTNLRNTVCVLA